MNPASILIGRSGGFDMHNSFLSPGSAFLSCCKLTVLIRSPVGTHPKKRCFRLQPPQLKLHREEGGAGQLSNGTMCWLPTHELPEEKWLSPGELLAPFRYNFLPGHAAKFAVFKLYLCCINHCPKTAILINMCTQTQKRPHTIPILLHAMPDNHIMPAGCTT